MKHAPNVLTAGALLLSALAISAGLTSAGCSNLADDCHANSTCAAPETTTGLGGASANAQAGNGGSSEAGAAGSVDSVATDDRSTSAGSGTGGDAGQ